MAPFSSKPVWASVRIDFSLIWITSVLPTNLDGIGVTGGGTGTSVVSEKLSINYRRSRAPQYLSNQEKPGVSCSSVGSGFSTSFTASTFGRGPVLSTKGMDCESNPNQ